MKKLLFIIALAISINCFGQTKDSVAFCEVDVFVNTAMNPNYTFHIYTPSIDGKVNISDNAPCRLPVGAIAKLGAQGWQLVSTRNENGSLIYTLQKVYKRK